MESADVLAFWFGKPDDPAYANPRARWFERNPAFDVEIERRFRGLYERAVAGQYDHWAAESGSCLALILVFDQFPRNMFRDTPRAFATDSRALALARHALERGFDQQVLPAHRTFFYLPFEHSEDLADQNRSVALFEAVEPHPGRATGIDYAVRHRDVIARFGRFPHRNAIMGRSSTPDEAEFLKLPNSGF
ncbi:MAG: DUF924 family protein [Gammaproteobacteria bacterium]